MEKKAKKSCVPKCEIKGSVTTVYFIDDYTAKTNILPNGNTECEILTLTVDQVFKLKK